MTTSRVKEHVGWVIFVTGLAIMLVEYGLHVWGHWHGVEYRIGFAPVGIGAVFAFIGWFWLYKQDALEGGKFIVDAFTGILSIVRSGRRASDPVVAVPAKPAAPIDPMDQDGDLDNPPHLGGDDAAPEVPHIPAPPPENASAALEAVAKAAHADPLAPVGEHVPGEGD